MTDMTRSHVKRETAHARAYSQAVITEGGRTIWLAGQVAIEDGAGRPLAGDFDG
jgi:2-iminobutanoate/2-iminopropanoate deaminase